MKQLSQSKYLFTRARVWTLALAVMTASTLSWAEAPISKSKPVKFSSTPDLNSSKTTDRLHALESDKSKNRKFSVKTLRDRRRLEKDPLVRHRLNQALASSEAPEASAALLESLVSDTDPVVRTGAAQSLSRFAKDATVSRALAQSLKNEAVPAVRYAAALSLCLSDTPEAIAALREASQDADVNIRRQIAYGLHRNFSPAGAQILKRLQSDRDNSVRDIARKKDL